MQAVKVERLAKTFDGIVAVQDLSFEVEAGTIHALVGPNGSGKTTTLRMVVGLVRPDSGSVILSTANDSKSRPRVGYMPDSPSFPGQMTAFELMDFYARICSIASQARRSVIEDILGAVGLMEHSRRRVETFTKGMRQRLGLAQALIGSPGLLVLDEPSTGLDPEGTVRFRNLLMELAEKGTTVLLSTHVLDEVDKLCGYITILDQGRALATGTLEDVHRQTGDTTLEVELDEIEDNVLRSLYSLPFVQELTLQGKKILIHLSTTDDVRAQVSRTIASCGSTVLSLQSPKSRMEDVFLHYLTNKNRGSFSTTSHVSRLLPESPGLRVFIKIPERSEVGSDVACEIGFVNVGAAPVWLQGVQEVIPEKLRIKDAPSGLNFGTRFLDLYDTKLGPLQTKNLKLVFNADTPGYFLFSPKAYYTNINDEKRIHAANPVSLHIAKPGETLFEVAEALKIFEFLKSEFVHDYLDSNLSGEACGWRSLVQTATGSGVSVSSLYGKDGRLGRGISELLSKGAAESKTFHGQRGRGGEATKIRVRQDFVGIKDELDQRTRVGIGKDGSGVAHPIE